MASGTITGSTSNRYITVRVTWSSVANEGNNTSTVTATLQARKSSESSESTYGTGTWYLVIDGQSQSFTKRVTMEANNTWVTIGTSTKTVNHTEDGTKTIAITASGKITSASTSWSSTSLSGTAALDSIPRQTKPTFDADTKEFGQSVHISLNPADDTFYHSVSYVWNGTTTLIANNVGTGLDFTIPASLISTIPNAASGTMDFVVTTYRANGSVVGTRTGSLTVTVPASCGPVINSIVLTDSGAQLPPEWGIFVNGMSVLHVNVNASGQYGATISSYVITALGQTKTGNNIDIAPIYQSGSINVSVTVTDSRGMTTSDSRAATVTVYDYASPVINSFSVVRCNQYGTPVDNGAYARVTIDCSISSLNGHNSMQIKISAKRSDAESYTQKRVVSPASTSHAATYVIDGIDPAYTYSIKAEVTDELATSWKDGTLAPEGAIISWRDGGIGIAFGKSAEEDYTAEFGWIIHGRRGAVLDQPLGTESGGTGNADGTIPLANVTIDNDSATAFVNSIKGAILNAMYPVGSLYITANSTSPAGLLGGTWEQIKDRFLLAAGDNHAAGEDGGAESQTIDGHTHRSPVGKRGNTAIALNPGMTGDTVTFAATAKPAWASSSNTTRYTDVTSYNTGSGGGHTVNTMPPYLAVYVWKRIA